ncbi:MAG TPA: RidA family protein [Terriglobales bacterium]|nr:RidA family protein [Terriglobales bacterium]
MKRSATVLLLFLLAAGVTCVAQKERKYIVLKRPAAEVAEAPFSEAVLAGDTLYVTGHIGVDPATGKVPAAPEQEARLVMDSVRRAVEAAGLSMDDLVQVTVFCSDVSYFNAFNGVYRTYFHGGNYPARAFVGSGKLLFGARFQVMAIGVKRK